jgi:hypothetical protein
MSHCSRVWLTGVLWYGHGFFSMSSNTSGPRGGLRGPLQAGSTARALSSSSSCPYARVTMGFLALLAPLLLLCGLLGHRPRACPSFRQIWPHRLLSGSEAGSDVEQLVGVDQWTSPELAHKVDRWCPRERHSRSPTEQRSGARYMLMVDYRIKVSWICKRTNPPS